MKDWLNGLHELNRRNEPAVLVTIVDVRGSAPREAGARMTVGLTKTWDTIGGGQLEHAAIESARFVLEDDDGAPVNNLERHALGPSLGQCCGGAVTLLLERVPGCSQEWLDALVDAERRNETVFVVTKIGGTEKRVVRRPEDPQLPVGARALLLRAIDTRKLVLDRDAKWFVDPVQPPDFNIILFGAGHVGRALAPVLATFQCNLFWIDSRSNQFPEHTAANVRAETVAQPENVVNDCPAGSFYLVMTHSHPLDLLVCEQILRRGDFAYCGLIGSLSKRRNFEKRLRLKGITETALNRLTCPIGIEGVRGKHPAEIAIAVAAEVLKLREILLDSKPNSETAVHSPVGKGS